MRRLTYLLFAAVIVTIAGCGHKHIAYHSTASVPFYTASTSTQMEAVEREESAFHKNYLVFAARDNQETGYVLLAPVGTGRATSPFRSADFSRAVPLKGENLTSFISGLDRALSDWGSESEGTATFYEFVHAPEDDIERVSENVIQYYASVRFTLSRTAEGPKGRLVLGASPETQLQSVIMLDDKEAVRTLRDLLGRAQSRVNDMSSES